LSASNGRAPWRNHEAISSILSTAKEGRKEVREGGRKEREGGGRKNRRKDRGKGRKGNENKKRKEDFCQ
jgi:hypothetical protein